MTVEADTQQQARAELRNTVVLLAVLVVIGVLAARGTFSSAWYFPHIFGGAVAVMSLLSLRTAWSELRAARVGVMLAIIVAAVVLPRVHLRGVQAKSAAYERRAGDVLIGAAAPAVPFASSLHLREADAAELQLEGSITLLNFWATWCGPCVEELPLLECFWNEHRDAGVRVVGVTRPYRRRDVAAETALVEQFLAERDVTFPIVIGADDSPAHVAYGIENLPASVLIDRDGTVVAFGAGVLGSLRLMDRAVEMLGGA